MQGTPGNLVPMMTIPTLTTDWVTISPDVGQGMKAFFNRGIISTQRVSNYLGGNPKKARLLKLVADYRVNHELRDSLSGDMVEALTGFLDKAKDSGRIYAGLYELGDAELIKKLSSLGKRLSIVLSNSIGQVDDKPKGTYINKKGQEVYHQKTIDQNLDARNTVKKKKAEVHDRIFKTGQIGHNKFLVYVDQENVPQAVLLGSTNWTSSGLCTQTNNTLIIEESALAQRYLGYWNLMKEDTEVAAGDSKRLQAANFREANSESGTLNIHGATLHSWFSPNTPKLRGKPGPGEPCPADMAQVIEYINGAKDAVLFLAFYPGSPSLANWSAAALNHNKDLFVRGMVTNNSASQGFYYDLIDERRTKGSLMSKEDYRVGAADAFVGTKMPKGWEKEILNAGFAIIHDKIMVIDPFSKDCVVITGSHNLGYRASYNNDENMVIIKGNQKLALAYATHVLDIYDHFNYRIYFKKYGQSSDGFLKERSEDFLSRHFDAQGNIKSTQLRFWMQGAERLA
ncbi:MAG: phospholipase D-like domain-containing protein [Bacteroidia bacterium]